MSSGIITDTFISAYNAHKPNLTINNIDLGIPVDGYSIIPNDSYIIQETGFGTIKTVWSHLSTSGDCTLYLKEVDENTANYIDKICLAQDTNYYVSFLGYMYRTESIDVTIQPSQGSINRLDVTLSFYGKLPYSTPVFRPGFSNKYSTEVSKMTNVTCASAMFIALPGQTLKNREDTILAMVRSTSGTVHAKICSNIKDYSDTNVNYNGALTSNFENPATKCGTILNIHEGLDEIAIAELSGQNITINFMRIKDNSVQPGYRNSVTLATPLATRLIIKSNKLYVFYEGTDIYRIETYNLAESNIAASRKVVEDSSQVVLLSDIPLEGETPKYKPPTTGGCYNMVLTNIKNKLLICNDMSNVVNAYDSYILPRSIFSTIPGVTSTLFTIEQVYQISDHKLCIFFRGLRAGSSYVYYAIINFRDTDIERNNKYNSFITDYKITNNDIPKHTQTINYFGITQTNTAVIGENNTCYMSTEAYADFYIEPGVCAVAQTSLGFKMVLVQVGTDLSIRCMSK